MKQIIDGKRYDTRTATEVADFWNGLGAGDFASLQETLYRTPRGRWFLVGHGGAQTRYAESSGNTVYGSSRIIALTENEARAFCERHADADVYEQYFTAEIA